MNTLYNLGDTVYVPAVVREIHVVSQQPTYTVAFEHRNDMPRQVYAENVVKSDKQFADVDKLIKLVEKEKKEGRDAEHSTSFQFDTGIDAAIAAIKKFYKMGD